MAMLNFIHPEERVMFKKLKGMPLLGEFKQRVRIVGDSTLPVERRVFALMEAVFMPVSFLTLVGLVVITVLEWGGIEVPGWIKGPLMTVLVSAAIGYITNWIHFEEPKF